MPLCSYGKDANGTILCTEYLEEEGDTWLLWTRRNAISNARNGDMYGAERRRSAVNRQPRVIPVWDESETTSWKVSSSIISGTAQGGGSSYLSPGNVSR